MRIHHLFIAAAIVATTTSADAKPRRIVIVDFVGPAKLAHAGQATALQVLGDKHDVVSAKRWSGALNAAKGRGPEQWSAAAKATGVDAVVEGWIDPAGVRTHAMTIAVRDAWTGREIDTITVRVDNNGKLDDRAAHKLATGLDDLLDWVDADPSLSVTLF